MDCADMSALLKRRRVAALQSGLAETILSHHEEHEAPELRRRCPQIQIYESGKKEIRKWGRGFLCSCFDSCAPAHSTCRFSHLCRAPPGGSIHSIKLSRVPSVLIRGWLS